MVRFGERSASVASLWCLAVRLDAEMLRERERERGPVAGGAGLWRVLGICFPPSNFKEFFAPVCV